MQDQEVKKSESAQAEEEILRLWQHENTFEKSLEHRKGSPYFSFNDGPPFANGLPHFGHSLVTAIKDSILRYKTMRGYYAPRRNGWDCHGLPVEYDVEKQLGISGKKQILDFGLDKFNKACRDSIFRYKAEWEALLERLGRWSDYEHYYATVDTSYTESVWWTLSEIHKKGLLYRGLKSVPYCPRCETPLSNFELNEGYRDNVPDPSVFVLFPLKDDSQTKLLAWTTTPWTLPANAALAVKADADYVYVRLKSDDSTLVLAKERLDVLELRGSDYKLLKTVKGQELVGKYYLPLYRLPESKLNQSQLTKAHQVFTDENVSLEDGTGILHVAPRYGEADLALGLAQDLPLLQSVDGSGHLVLGPEKALGKFFKDADEFIIADLSLSGRVFAAEIAQHTYPFCWRCDTPLMYFATSTWFVAVTKVKDELIQTAKEIKWTPAHIKEGRFGKWLEGARDWAISRNRYWGAPMPIWANVSDPDDYLVVSSIEELKSLAGKGIKIDDLHRPYIDDISFQKNGKTYNRIEEVLDCWFESGSSPYGQWHYPFEGQEVVKESLPADFVTEGLDQTRLWFYVQHVISTILFKRPAFKNVVVNGMILAADGQKLSKRLRNYPPIEEIFNKEGADSLRLYLLSSPQATETADYLRFYRDAVTDIQRNILITLEHSYKFFKTYADLDQWRAEKLEPPLSENILDQWILARLGETIAESTKSADNFRIAHAIEPVFSLVDDLSNWYIRRSRRRFWRSQNDNDKLQAYATLHYVLVRLCQLLAPWAPFISDKLWRGLVEGREFPLSVHLSDWPSVKEPNNASQKVLEDMRKVREAVAQGLSQRAEAKIKVRQPLRGAVVYGIDILPPQLIEVIRDELNVKVVSPSAGDSNQVMVRTELDTKLTDDLKAEGIARELIRHIQNARKSAGYNVEDRISLRVETDSTSIVGAFKKFKDTIFAETLTTSGLRQEEKPEYTQEVEIEGQVVGIALKRV